MANDRVGVDAQVGSDLYVAISTDGAGDGTGATWDVLTGARSGVASFGLEDTAGSRELPGQSKSIARQSTGRHDWSGTLEIDRNVLGCKYFDTLRPVQTYHYIVGFRGVGTKVTPLRAYKYKSQTSKTITINAEDVQTFSVNPAVDGSLEVGTIHYEANAEKATFTKSA